MQMSLLIPKNDNLVTYFVLPMLNINKLVFGRSYKTAYLSDSNLIYIELRRNMVEPIYKFNANFVTEIILDRRMFCVFAVPSMFKEDLILFKEGLYSKMSREIKKQIYTVSTLPYNKTMSDFKMSHPILHALDSTQVLRKFLIEYLNVKVLSDSNELIDPPELSWYIESVTKTEKV